MNRKVGSVIAVAAFFLAGCTVAGATPSHPTTTPVAWPRAEMTRLEQVSPEPFAAGGGPGIALAFRAVTGEGEFSREYSCVMADAIPGMDDRSRVTCGPVPDSVPPAPDNREDSDLWINAVRGETPELTDRPDLRPPATAPYLERGEALTLAGFTCGIRPDRVLQCSESRRAFTLSPIGAGIR